ncbi:hypothetical protein PR048_013780 [Dryococelus australis]|uniref:Uncharacterized protein n=1 Tax=Dryococelus australis TaxID=614101 RepID=A0ABQ9HT54_9NEOP|nr:hypothetical protein PR048_013780 [Dryococelus australis]
MPKGRSLVLLNPTKSILCLPESGHGGVVVRLLAYHLGKPGSIPGEVASKYSHVGIVPDDVVGRPVFLGDLPFSPSPHSGAAPYSPRVSLIGSQNLDNRIIPLSWSAERALSNNFGNPLNALRTPYAPHGIVKSAVQKSKTSLKAMLKHVMPVGAVKRHVMLAEALMGHSSLEQVNIASWSHALTHVYAAHLEPLYGRYERQEIKFDKSGSIPLQAALLINLYVVGELETYYRSVLVVPRDEATPRTALHLFSVARRPAYRRVLPFASARARYLRRSDHRSAPPAALCDWPPRAVAMSTAPLCTIDTPPFSIVCVHARAFASVCVRASIPSSSLVFVISFAFLLPVLQRRYLTGRTRCLFRELCSTCHQNGGTSHQHVGMPFANQHLLIYLPTRTSSNRGKSGSTQWQIRLKTRSQVPRAANQRTGARSSKALPRHFVSPARGAAKTRITRFCAGEGISAARPVEMQAGIARSFENRVRFPAGSRPEFRKWESCQTMPLTGGFSRGSPISPAISFRRCSILRHFTLIGFQDLALHKHKHADRVYNGHDASNLFTLEESRVTKDYYLSHIGINRCSQLGTAHFPCRLDGSVGQPSYRGTQRQTTGEASIDGTAAFVVFSEDGGDCRCVTDYLTVQKWRILFYRELQPYTPAKWRHWPAACWNVCRQSASVYILPRSFRRDAGCTSQRPLRDLLRRARKWRPALWESKTFLIRRSLPSLSISLPPPLPALTSYLLFYLPLLTAFRRLRQPHLHDSDSDAASQGAGASESLAAVCFWYVLSDVSTQVTHRTAPGGVRSTPFRVSGARHERKPSRLRLPVCHTRLDEGVAGSSRANGDGVLFRLDSRCVATCWARLHLPWVSHFPELGWPHTSPSVPGHNSNFRHRYRT